MANQSLAGVYNGGAVSLNSQPYIQAHAQAIARKQAQDDALFKYFGDLGKDLTPSGMHSNDVDALMQAKNDWQQSAMKNKDLYLHPSKDNGKTYTEVSAKYNHALSIAQQSKAKVANLAQFNKILSDPAKAALLPESVLDDIHRASLPVTHENYKPMDFADIKFNPKPWDQLDENKLVNELKSFKGTEDPHPVITKDKGTKQLISTYYSKFENKDLIGMYSMGATRYNSHPGFKQKIDSIAKAGSDVSDPNHHTYVELNDIFKKYYGKEMDSPEDISGAFILSNNPNKSSRTVIKNDQEALNVQKSNLIEGRSNRKAAQTTGTWVDDAAAAVGSKNPDEMKKVFGHLFAGNGTGKHQDVNLSADGSQVELHYTTKEHDKYGPEIKKNVFSIPLNDPNFKDKLAGYYQLTTGADKKTENKPYYKESSSKPATNNKDRLDIGHLLKQK